MAAAKKKDFKQGVDYFLSNEIGDNEQKVIEPANIEKKEQSSPNIEDTTHVHTDKYTHTYDDTHGNILDRPLPARPQGERKSRRLNLLVRPSMYDSLSMIAARAESSVNDLINNILEDFVANAKKEI